MLRGTTLTHGTSRPNGLLEARFEGEGVNRQIRHPWLIGDGVHRVHRPFATKHSPFAEFGSCSFKGFA